jgi:transposase
MRYGYSLPERLQKFNELLSNKQANAITKYDIPTVNGNELHEVFHVSVELPKYRLDNTRTLALQEQYIYSNNLPEDFFNEVESDQVQEIQHNLLKTLIRSSDKEKDLIKYFSDQTQTEPLILTHDGFVISGNRRLCAFRELLDEDYEQFKRFSQVRVVILPNLDADKIDQIEDFLEQQVDIKEPFTWVNRAMGYRRRMQKYNYSDQRLADITGVKKNQINSLIEKLEMADRYLDSIGKPKDYNQVDKDEYAFDKIVGCLQKDKGPVSRKNAFEKISFLSIKNKGTIADRMYKNIPVIYQSQQLIYNDIAEEFEEELEEIKSQQASNSSLASLELFADDATSISKLLDNPEVEEKVIEIVSDRIEEHFALEREKKKKSSVLEKVIKAHTALIEANSLISDVSHKSGVVEQIANIEKQLAKLKEWVNKQ